MTYNNSYSNPNNNNQSAWSWNSPNSGGNYWNQQANLWNQQANSWSQQANSWSNNTNNAWNNNNNNTNWAQNCIYLIIQLTLTTNRFSPAINLGEHQVLLNGLKIIYKRNQRGGLKNGQSQQLGSVILALMRIGKDTLLIAPNGTKRKLSKNSQQS